MTLDRPNSSARRLAARVARRAVLRLEPLEARTAPAVFSVSVAEGPSGLRAAISQANTNADSSNTIQLAAGTYQLTDAAAGSLLIQDQAAGVAAKTLTIVGPPGGTTIQGDSLWSDRIFLILGSDQAGQAVLMQDLTITGGIARDSGPIGGPAALGGGLLIDGAQVTLTHVTVTGNAALGADGTDAPVGHIPGQPGQDGGDGADAQGGGIFLRGGSLTLNNATIGSNAAVGGRGGHGGDGGHGASGDPSAATEAGRAGSGGLLAGPGGDGGSAFGGGFYAIGSSLTVSASTIRGNQAIGGAGGDSGAGGDGGRGADGAQGGGIEGLPPSEGGRGGGGGLGNYGGKGGTGSGGGLWTQSHVEIVGGSVQDNRASGGAGGSGGRGGRGGNGGVGSPSTNESLFNGGWGGYGGDAGDGGAGGRGLGGGASLAGYVLIAGTHLTANRATGGAAGNAGTGAVGGDGGAGGPGLQVQGESIAYFGGYGGYGGFGGTGGLTPFSGGGNGGAASGGAIDDHPGVIMVLEAAVLSGNLVVGGSGGQAGGPGDGGRGGTGGPGYHPGSGGPGGLGGYSGRGGSGGDAEGAGGFVSGNLYAAGDILTDNTAIGGDGGQGGRGGNGGPGGWSGGGIPPGQEQSGRGGEGGRGGDGGRARGAGLLRFADYGKLFLAGGSISSCVARGGAGGPGGDGGSGWFGGNGGDAGNGGNALGGDLYTDTAIASFILNGTTLNGSVQGGGTDSPGLPGSSPDGTQNGSIGHIGMPGAGMGETIYGGSPRQAGPANALHVVWELWPRPLNPGSPFSVVAIVTDSTSDTSDPADYDGPVTVSVPWSNSGRELLSGGLVTATANHGIAVFSGLSLPLSGTFTVWLSAPGLIQGGSPLTVSGNTGGLLVVRTAPPSSIPSGGLFGLTVAAVDANNVPLANFNGPITLSLGNNPGGGTLGGTLTVNAVNGVATFSGLTLDRAGDNDTIRVNAEGLVPVTTRSFDVYAGGHPWLTGVSPNSGPVRGSRVILAGDDLDAVTAIYVGGVPTSFSLQGPNLLVTIPPSTRVGPVDIALAAVVGTTTFARAFTYTVTPLPDGRVGQAYSQQLRSAAGTYFYPSSPSAWPPGLSLSPSGILSGAPTVPGSSTFFVRVGSSPSDSGASQPEAYAITIAPPVSVPPTSAVAPLPPVTAQADFPVSWSDGGSGVATYDVFVSDNGGPFTAWLAATTATSAMFHGADGHAYAFYSVATDRVGHRQPTPASPQATTTVHIAPPPVQGITVQVAKARGRRLLRVLDPTGALKFTIPLKKTLPAKLQIETRDVNGDGVADAILRARQKKKMLTFVYSGRDGSALPASLA